MASNDINIGTGNGTVGMAFYGAASGTDAVTMPATIADIADIAAITGAKFSSMGEVSSDGVTITNAGSKQSIRNWAGATRRVTYSEPGYEISCTFITTTNSTLKALFGEASALGETGVFETAATQNHGKVQTLHLDGKTTSGVQAFLLLAKDGDDQFMIEIPDGIVSVDGDITFVEGEALSWPATIVTGDGGMTIIKDDGQTS